MLTGIVTERAIRTRQSVGDRRLLNIQTLSGWLGQGCGKRTNENISWCWLPARGTMASLSTWGRQRETSRGGEKKKEKRRRKHGETVTLEIHLMHGDHLMLII